MANIPAAPIINGQKTFIPLENNPETITTLARSLGVAQTLTFHDVLSLSDPALLQLVPRPAIALIFLCAGPTYRHVRTTLTPPVPAYIGSGPGEPVTWIRQTIGHSCGAMALIHAVANGAARQHITAGSTLDELLRAGRDVPPTERARLLYESAALEQAHMAAATAGASRPPDPSEPNGYSFVAFVKGDDGQLWELEGYHTGPVPRGKLSEDDDLLSEAAIQMGPARFIEAGNQQGHIEFSIVAVVEEQPEKAETALAGKGIHS